MKQHGFTLVEVMVALLVASVAVAMVQRAFQMLTSSVVALEDHQRRDSQRAEARRWLVEALGSVEAGIDSASPFDGQSSQLRGTTWLMGERGWPERMTVELGLRGMVLQLRSRDRTIEITDSVRTVEFDYLLTTGLESRWVSQWTSPISPPLAIRVRVTRNRGIDTTLVLVGRRG